MLIGVLIGMVDPNSIIITFLGLLFALRYGVAEALGYPLQSPSIKWQVPADWVKGKSNLTQTFIWGAILGPGLVTRNPFAGIWLLVVLIGLAANPLGAAAVGAAHGIGRAVGTVRTEKGKIHSTHALDWRPLAKWRAVDGLVLLFVAGMLGCHMIQTMTT